MCGIFFTNQTKEDTLCEFQSLRHRGPDGSQVLFRETAGETYFYGFHRLAIINPHVGVNQPFQRNNAVLLCNGEIYNWRELARLFDITIESDCELLLYLYFKFERNFTKLVQWLDGEFAIILHDIEQDAVYAVRDFMGIRPLYWAYDVMDRNTDTSPRLIISSEMRAMRGSDAAAENISHIIPRHIYKFTNAARTMTVDAYWTSPEQVYILDPAKNSLSSIYYEMYNALYESVCARVSADRPVGCLLSGGLDSSIIAAIASRLCKKLQCFVIGAEDSPDVVAAKKVATHLKVHLNVINFDVNAALKAIPAVINSLETYDITTVRASTPQWHLAKWISQNSPVKVILSGEGSDELFMNGYAYTKLYTDSEELWVEGGRLMQELYMFDCLRTDRTMAAWGLEVRVPFLQKYFVEYVRRLDPDLFLYSKTPYCGLDRSIEKALLRNMAARYGLLPDEIIWRPKEAFSDAVGFSWKDIISQHCVHMAPSARDHLTPVSPEAEWYRRIFDEQFPKMAGVLSHYWMPKKFDTNDPSARVLPTYHGTITANETAATESSAEPNAVAATESSTIAATESSAIAATNSKLAFIANLPAILTSRDNLHKN
jgi:asparagine synthase (glutamine-hydrolysing)